jgi:hypothetical protein
MKGSGMSYLLPKFRSSKEENPPEASNGVDEVPPEWLIYYSLT